MPVKIADGLPAQSILENEHIFIMTEHRALHQDIRPLKIGILNLMPTKVATETQILRSLSNTPLQIEVTLVQTSTYTSRNTSSEHLLNFYKTFDEIKNLNFDGFIITGAPVEHLDFEQVDYRHFSTVSSRRRPTAICSPNGWKGNSPSSMKSDRRRLLRYAGIAWLLQ